MSTSTDETTQRRPIAAVASAASDAASADVVVRPDGPARPTFTAGALTGNNPLCYFAALGLLDVATRAWPSEPVTLAWRDNPFRPTAIFEGVPGSDEAAILEALTEAVLTDRDRWISSSVLNGPNGINNLTPDLKVAPEEVTEWLNHVIEHGTPEDLRLFHGLLAEGAVDSSKGTTSKPTHLQFTAGQQKFLVMARDLRDAVDAERVSEALIGPWRYDSKLPVMGWDVSGERVYALRATDPSKDKKLGVPGADWLALLGLSFFPVMSDTRGRLLTTGCEPGWKKGSFSWRLWDRQIPASVVRSLILAGPAFQLDGLTQAYRSEIRRSDQGGYGSFGPPQPIRTEHR